ncbi:uncharacterized protein LOC123314807 [Coccinella septempunctata]|uniref:uncharacterized protein LOC123314807 n=1 Tax=Coccinella septempunctata TaxID=41139 RepID=UPI001D061B36|nr:uncharacterized protein LOC123314807 [Coccinella septempunctata]
MGQYNEKVSQEVYALKELIKNLCEENKKLVKSNKELSVRLSSIEEKISTVDKDKTQQKGAKRRLRSDSQNNEGIENERSSSNILQIQDLEVISQNQREASRNTKKYNNQKQNLQITDINTTQVAELERFQRMKMNEVINLTSYADKVNVSGQKGDENNQSNQSENEVGNGKQWTTIVRRRRSSNSKQSIICTGSSVQSENGKIKGAIRKKWLYVGRLFGKDISPEDLREYIGETEENSVDIRKLETKGPNSAFSVGVGNDELFHKINCPTYWPKGVVLRPFNFKNFFQKVK